MPRKPNPLPPMSVLMATFECNGGRLLNKISRTARKAGEFADRSMRGGYRTVYVDGALHYAHRVIFALHAGRDTNDFIDHINSDHLDNNPENLRAVSNSENKYNSRSYRNNTSGAKGVHLRKDNGKWRASINADGKRHNLGEFDTQEEAAAIVAAARIDLHGEFARMA